ncbi:protein RALF-like 33 [Pistacia vera]|uniref:protein RALF-like 33 n=1 Tax=Pistacia vera TaxID=55513 RepID=UPI00126348A5|nr:protein RALF-like 33 [Pistacia vera]
MANLLTSRTLLLAVSSMIMIFMMNPLSTVVASGDHQLNLGWLPTAGSSLVGEEGEFEMDSEINRRILATSNYISYGALQRNTVPCSRRGASYYNCQNGGQANPYSRGCSSISRCRS